MANVSIARDEILQNTLFHIQLNRLQYIDDFPDSVAATFDRIINDEGISKYDDMKRKLYRIKTNFFTINKDKISKREFFMGLYRRLFGKA